MNILITGTPGCGKTTLSEGIKDRLLEVFPNVNHWNISQIVKRENLHEGYDKKFDTFILNEDKLLDFLEDSKEFSPSSRLAVNIIDYHCCELFPESWIDLLVVLTTDNTTLYDRLAARNYSAIKITENVECEIMQVVLMEAEDSFEKEKIVVLENTNQSDLERNIELVVGKIRDHVNKKT